jgi:CubicO group peptidase (beta-lactamase class C family)
LGVQILNAMQFCSRLLFLFCFGILLQSSLSAQGLVNGLPEKNGFSAERLARIDKIVQQYIDSGWINGAIGLVARNGQIVYHKGLGFDNKAAGKPMTKDAIFRIASQTKAITSVGVMQLVEQGKILLDDPISKYIPAFRKPRVLEKFNKADSSFTSIPAKKEISIRELLTHTSGIGYAQIGDPVTTAIYAKAGVVGGIGVQAGMTLSNKHASTCQASTITSTRRKMDLWIEYRFIRLFN